MFRSGKTHWKQAPFLRLTIPLMTGIISASYIPPNMEFSSVFMLCSLPVLALLFILVINLKPADKKYKASLLYLFIFLLGGLLTLRADTGRREDFAGKRLTGGSEVLLALREPLIEKPASWKAEADMISVGNDHAFQATSGRAVLYFRKAGSPPPLHYGDVILLSGDHLEPIKNSGNPGAFDYKHYCHLQNIYYQAYLPAGSWKKLSVTRVNPLQSFFIFCRLWCLKTLSKYITKEPELSVAEALLAGYRDDLDKGLVQAYAHAGVVHIIAISGLHLGLIYLVLLWIFMPIPDKGHGRWLKGGLIMLSLWCFALTTGAAPSALRAAVMFSFLTAGKFFFHRQADTFNSLAASAFLLLCYHPFLLFDVGFQLSYLAVSGILVFQKPIFHLLIFRNRIWNYFWEMMSLSIAAELLTFPLALYYFHRFPVLFLLTNLAVIPLSSFILYGEVFLLLAAAVTPLAAFAGMVITHAVSIMNGIILEVDDLSFSSLQAGTFTVAEVILIYLFIITAAWWLFCKNRKAFILSLSVLLCFSVMTLFDFIRASTQRKIIVYNVPRYTAVDFVKGLKTFFVGDTDVNKNAAIFQYDLSPARMALHTSLTHKPGNSIITKNFIRFCHTSMVVLDSAFGDRLKEPSSFPADYVLVSHDPELDLKRVKHIFSPRLIIFDSSNPWWKIEKWKTACKQLNLPCFSVPDDGAWIADVK